MEPNSPQEILKRLGQLIAHVDAMGYRQQDLLTQLAQLKETGQQLFDDTGKVRAEMVDLSQQIEQIRPSQALTPQIKTHEEKPMELDTTPPPSEDFTPNVEQDSTEAWEFALGVKWFSRIGIVILLIGLTMALNYSLPYMTPVVKVVLGGFFAGGLFFLGTRLYSQFSILGRILQGGGLSLGYLTLYAMFFFPSVQLFNHSPAGWMCLGIYVALMMIVSQRLQSQAVALLSMVFGYYTASYSGYPLVALVSTSFLTASCAALAWRHPDWRLINKASLVGILWTYFYWNNHHEFANPDLRHQQTDLFLAINCGLLYAFGCVARKGEDLAIVLLSTLGFYTAIRLTSSPWADHHFLELMIATVQFGTLGLLASSKTRQISDILGHSLLFMGLSFLALWTVNYFHGEMMAAALGLEALFAGLLSLRSRYRNLLKTAAGLLWFCAWCALMPKLENATEHYNTILTTLWITAVGLVLEACIFKATETVSRFLLLGLSQFQLMLAFLYIMPSHWMTLSFVVTGLAFLLSGFVYALKKYRWTGLSWFFIAMIHLVFVDIPMLSTLYKIILFIIFGMCLLGASYGYSILQKRKAK